MSRFNRAAFAVCVLLLGACDQTQRHQATQPATDDTLSARAADSRVADDSGLLTVLFAPGRSDLDQRGMAIIREIVAAIRARDSRLVVVHAFSDTVGSPEASMAISLRRGNAVRDALIAQGVRAQIDVRAYGATNLAVPTGPNTPEQRNRRAYVTLPPGS